MLSEDEIERNVQGIRRILESLIGSSNGAGPAPQILNNLVSASSFSFLRKMSLDSLSLLLTPSMLSLLP